MTHRTEMTATEKANRAARAAAAFQRSGNREDSARMARTAKAFRRQAILDRASDNADRARRGRIADRNGVMDP